MRLITSAIVSITLAVLLSFMAFHSIRQQNKKMKFNILVHYHTGHHVLIFSMSIVSSMEVITLVITGTTT